MRKPGRARQFYMPTMPPDRSRRKWVWNMPSKPPQQNGVAGSGIRPDGVTAAQSLILYQQAARAGLIGISMCQSDPMVVPFGGAEIYYGTNPLAFAAPGEGDEILTFDMADYRTGMGKVLDARSRNMSIPDTWAVDKNGAPTTDPFAVNALLPAAGPKGYGPDDDD
ncbi:ureidoglycolate dehydrogenase [Escherichia coli]|uniref:Ureidoglycolate dehydrogenase n=1 Tax=Escherichia coli TaxID=562 RepID=A0A376MSM7_ECOLX|nr:ureidoglycolate dehydrogenase [Escherichia coli]